MSGLTGSPGFRHGQRSRTGVLLVNLGTPDAPTTSAVRRYLAEFLSDPRVVELPRVLWLPLLYGVILNLRPRRSAHAYQAVWREDGAPLLRLSEDLLHEIEQGFTGTAADELRFALAMRYGNPSIPAVLDSLLADGVRRLLVVPLYPQYASATTASVHDAVFRDLEHRRWLPQLRFVTDYHARPAYIEALAASVRDHWQQHGRGERLLLSFHGIPRDTFLAGDPYFCQCQATARLLADALELAPADFTVSFQSRVGPKAWLEPYTEQTLRDWGREGVGDIDVICPGFAVDCLETLEEIALRNAADYRAAGGGTLRYIPALNAAPAHAAMLGDLIREELGAWADRIDDPDARAAAAARAAALGADQVS